MHWLSGLDPKTLAALTAFLAATNALVSILVVAVTLVVTQRQAHKQLTTQIKRDTARMLLDLQIARESQNHSTRAAAYRAATQLLRSMATIDRRIQAAELGDRETWRKEQIDPTTHPDMALQKRDDVLDELRLAGTILTAESFSQAHRYLSEVVVGRFGMLSVRRSKPKNYRGRISRDPQYAWHRLPVEVFERPAFLALEGFTERCRRDLTGDVAGEPIADVLVDEERLEDYRSILRLRLAGLIAADEVDTLRNEISCHRDFREHSIWREADS